MKKVIYFALSIALLSGISACGDKESKERELDLKQKELALKEKELNMQTQTGGGNTATPAPNTTPTTAPANNSQNMGTIIGKGVIIRQGNTVESAKMGNYDENERVTILSEARPQNQNQAIAAKPIDLYDEYNGKVVVTKLNKGKALVIESFDGSMYNVSYQDPKYGKLYAIVFPDELQNISNEVWYKVRRKNGSEGWVLGKFLKK